MPGSNYFDYQVCPLPWWGQHVIALPCLESVQDQVAYLEGLGGGGEPSRRGTARTFVGTSSIL
jgi:hypothetical protein